jgi:hypothetical protein
MKITSIIMGILFLSLLACNDNKKNASQSNMEVDQKTETADKLEGTWELTGFYNYKDNVVVDSFDMNPDFRQIKMYTDDKVMWCKHKPADSSEWFGYGSYNFDGERLTEKLDFGSSVMNEVIEAKKEFIFELSLSNNHFEQIELDEDGNRIYSENYKRVE